MSSSLLKHFRLAISTDDTNSIEELLPQIVENSERLLKRFVEENPEYPIHYPVVTNYGDVLKMLKKKATRKEGQYLLRVMKTICERNNFQVFTKIDKPISGDIFYIVPYLTYQYYETFKDDDGNIWWIVRRLGVDSGEKERHCIKPIDNFISGIHVPVETMFCKTKHTFFFFNS